MTDSTPPTNRKHRSKHTRRLVPIAWVAGAAAATMLGLTISGTLSGFTAEIDNSTNTAGSGTLLMQESNNAGTVNCYSNGAAANSAIGAANTNTCATINKFGGDQTGGLNLAPGTGTNVTTVKIKNAGTIAASMFTLTPYKANSGDASACTQSNNTGNTGVSAVGAYGSATDFCSQVNVVIKQAGTTIFSGTAAQLASGTGATTALPSNLGPVAAGATVTLEFDVSLSGSASNAEQGLALSEPLAWKFVQ
ncbi:hypothetical protein [Jatrophihabitans endophyticus]|uniref:hypothetical protein n=1 Tax=Jatrophihabitans endophyticus TaxID=1206085 RepID=UPI0019E3AEB2|nr:hypothetical protein [Jatrophihabitans endophyticus]MBE7188979.1 hypothetical protein [Jatrophihabitans endophyticus]